jgi:hypothetical protein
VRYVRFLFASLALIASISVAADAWIVSGRVVGVSDGDTITVLDSEKKQHKNPHQRHRRTSCEESQSASANNPEVVVAKVSPSCADPGISTPPDDGCDDQILALHGHRSPDRETPADEIPPDDRGSACPVRGSRAGTELARAIGDRREPLVQVVGPLQFVRDPAR